MIPPLAVAPVKDNFGVKWYIATHIKDVQM